MKERQYSKKGNIILERHLKSIYDQINLQSFSNVKQANAGKMKNCKKKIQHENKNY